jgi:hypothetical protein
MSEFVLAGLVKRRAQLAGDIETSMKLCERWRWDLESLDATIVQFSRDDQAQGLPAAERPVKSRPNEPDHSERSQASGRAADGTGHCLAATGRAGIG